MLNRRAVLLGAAALAASGGHSAAATEDAYFAGTALDHGVEFRRTNMALIRPEFRRQTTREIEDPEPGRIVVDTRDHVLYLTSADGTSIRYGVGVGREGFQWFGSAQIMRKAVWPNWTPPPEMLLRQPGIPRFVKGGPDNPLGPRALYLYRDGRDLLYRIHGTTEPWTIGTDVSSGCIRMLNEDLIDLYDRAPTGTKVLVMKHLV